MATHEPRNDAGEEREPLSDTVALFQGDTVEVEPGHEVPRSIFGVFVSLDYKGTADGLKERGTRGVLQHVFVDVPVHGACHLLDRPRSICTEAYQVEPPPCFVVG